MSKIMNYILDNEIEIIDTVSIEPDDETFYQKWRKIEAQNEKLKKMIDDPIKLDLSECPF